MCDIGLRNEIHFEFLVTSHRTSNFLDISVDCCEKDNPGLREGASHFPNFPPFHNATSSWTRHDVWLKKLVKACWMSAGHSYFNRSTHCNSYHCVFVCFLCFGQWNIECLARICFLTIFRFSCVHQVILPWHNFTEFYRYDLIPGASIPKNHICFAHASMTTIFLLAIWIYLSIFFVENVFEKLLCELFARRWNHFPSHLIVCKSAFTGNRWNWNAESFFK